MMKNYVFYIMDSVRWDQFRDADTPNFDELADEMIEAYSSGTWTSPSMRAVLLGVLPSSRDKELWHNESWLELLPVRLKKRGYSLFGYSGNPLFLAGDYPQIKWDNFHFQGKRDRKDPSRLGAPMVSECIKDIKESESPFFSILLLVDTHVPYFGEVYAEEAMEDPEKAMRAQRKSITYLDKLFGILYREAPEDTEFYIFSDHGEVFRKDVRGHNPKHKPHKEKVSLGYPELLSVPMVKVSK